MTEEVVEIPVNPTLTTTISQVEGSNKRRRSRRNPVPIFDDPVEAKTTYPKVELITIESESNTESDDCLSNKSTRRLRSGPSNRVCRRSGRIEQVCISPETDPETVTPYFSSAKRNSKKTSFKIIDYTARDGVFLYKVQERGERAKTMTGETVRRKCLLPAIDFLESRIIIKNSLPFERILQIGEYLKTL